ncbi:hypothetical protein FOYG_09401 [Fusarium oxysporum NRRL 32931]|uniref:Uncharacterized protein n=1 Tax=Fusarium oxysporum NRRL 32931 TaxID=660029 RepID=W9I526_FUSOX|nr:hypothetical protein FOYG_09401 [Fusarium oxysporum NRRL 32931]
MSRFTPVNAHEVQEKRAQARRCYWCVVTGSVEECCKHAEEADADLQHCQGDDEMQLCEEEAAVQEETEGTVQAKNEAPSQAAAEPPVVEERASMERVSRSGKVNNRKTCPICSGKEYNMSNFTDHMKVHRLEVLGVRARHPCECCKDPRKCLVAPIPLDIETYSCICCLRAHKKCSFNGLKRRGEKCKPGVHPALERRIDL